MQITNNEGPRMALWIGGVLAGAGVLTLVGYGLYHFLQGFFGPSGAPLPIQVAVPAITLGMLILLSAAVLESRREPLKEIEY